MINRRINKSIRTSFDCIRLSGFSDGLAVSTIIDFSRKSTAAGSFTDFLPWINRKLIYLFILNRNSQSLCLYCSVTLHCKQFLTTITKKFSFLVSHNSTNCTTGTHLILTTSKSSIGWSKVMGDTCEHSLIVRDTLVKCSKNSMVCCHCVCCPIELIFCCLWWENQNCYTKIERQVDKERMLKRQEQTSWEWGNAWNMMNTSAYLCLCQRLRYRFDTNKMSCGFKDVI